MLYPYIYTGTRYHDFRLITSQMIHNLPLSIKQYFEAVSRTMIKAENSQLINPSWILVKKNGYILWGIAVLNKVLGNTCLDDDNRPVRGFFGFISDKPLSRLPYDISYFKILYSVYVIPIWDTREQTQQVIKQMPPMSDGDFIENLSRLNNEINVDNNICRIFPSTSQNKSLIETVFASAEDCSIATNVHTKRQCIEFGKHKISFTNAIMSSDSNIRTVEDIYVYGHQNVTDVLIQNENLLEHHSDYCNAANNTFCSTCGQPTNGADPVCDKCKKKQQNQKHLKYGLYGFIILICVLLLLYSGSTIWNKILNLNLTIL